MYAVVVLDSNALADFRSEHPWLNFPAEIAEVSIYFDGDEGPTRLTALSRSERGETAAFDIDDLGGSVILALIRQARHSSARLEDSPEDECIRAILESLPVFDGTRPATEVDAERKAMLQDGYEKLRRIGKDRFEQALAQATDATERDRLLHAIRAMPEHLADVKRSSKGIFLEVDLWSLLAILSDEYHLPADRQLPERGQEADGAGPRYAAIEAITLADPLIQALFDLSPVALSLSTTGQENSQYVRVNQSYLDLIGKSWEEIRGHEMVSSGVVLGSDDRRAARLALLDDEGGYKDQTAEIRRANGETVAVTISARRLFLAGQPFDFEVLTPVESA